VFTNDSFTIYGQQQWKGSLYWALGQPNEWNIRFHENVGVPGDAFYESLYTGGKLYHTKPGTLYPTSAHEYTKGRDVREFPFPHLLLNSNGILPLINQIDADVGTEQVDRDVRYEKKVSNGLYDYTLSIENWDRREYRLQYRDTSGLNVTITGLDRPDKLYFHDQFNEPVPSYYTLS